MRISHLQRLSSGDRKAAAAFAALGFFAFAVASVITPYEESGEPLTHGSHTQVGLPPCAFYAATQYPCPGCGLTTSFALLVHGDLRNSLSANEAGAVVATLSGIALVYFTVVSASGWALRGVGVDRPLVWLVCGSALMVVARYTSVLFASRERILESVGDVLQYVL